MDKLKKPSRMIVILAALAVMLGVYIALSRSIKPPLVEMKVAYEEKPASLTHKMRLVWGDTVYYDTPTYPAERGAEIGYASDEDGTWRIYELKGYSRDYLLAVDSEGAERVMSVHPLEAPWRQYVLENATDRQKLERMLSVTLFSDGTAQLSAPPISSYLPPKCTYAFSDGDLIISADIDTQEAEGAFGVKNGGVIARFTVDGDDALVFKSASVPLFADEGARYVPVQNTVTAASYQPIKWLDYYFDGNMPWDGSLELEVPEYPGTVFYWTPYEVKAVDGGGEKTLFGGMPVWNVYLADLTGDGLPELCATVSFGSGIIDERIIVCDYAAGNTYDLNDRMCFDYALYLDNGRLMVRQTKYPNPQGDALAAGELAIVDGQLTAVGIDRTRPETGEGAD